jgi:hypothetical protein
VTDTATSAAEQVQRRRQDWWIVAATVLLIIGIGLLVYSSKPFSPGPDEGAANAGPSLTTSPLLVTLPVLLPGTPAPTLGGTGTAEPAPPVTTTITTTIAVPVSVAAAPVAPEGSSSAISLVTTFSGLASSLLGLMAAFVSLRARSRRPTGGAS